MPIVFGEAVNFEAAGIKPQPAKDAENTVYTLRKNFNIDASKHVPRDVRSLDVTAFTLVIALEKDAAGLAQELGAPASKVKLWKVQDPLGLDLPEYDRASLEIKKKVPRLKASSDDKDQAQPPAAVERTPALPVGGRGWGENDQGVALLLRRYNDDCRDVRVLADAIRNLVSATHSVSLRSHGQTS